MNNKYTLLFLFLAVFSTGLLKNTFAQSEPVLYFCEKYDADKGEIGVGDRFYTGPITVVVKSSHALLCDDVHIQFDRYNESTGKFEFYKKFSYTISPTDKYVYFRTNSESDLRFDNPGFYRVFLLDHKDKTVASSLIEVIR